jgi:hypothetical protein
LDSTKGVGGYIVAVQIVNHFRQLLNEKTLKGITQRNKNLVTYLPPFILKRLLDIPSNSLDSVTNELNK